MKIGPTVTPAIMSGQGSLFTLATDDVPAQEITCSRRTAKVKTCPGPLLINLQYAFEEPLGERGAGQRCSDLTR